MKGRNKRVKGGVFPKQIGSCESSFPLLGKIFLVSETCFMIVENLPVSVKNRREKRNLKNLGKPSRD